MTALEYIGIALLLAAFVIVCVMLPKVTAGMRLFIIAWCAQLYSAPLQFFPIEQVASIFIGHGMATAFAPLLWAGCYRLTNRLEPRWIYLLTALAFLTRGSLAAIGEFDLARQITLPFEVFCYAAAAWVILKNPARKTIVVHLLVAGFMALIATEIWDATTNDASRQGIEYAMVWVIVLVSCFGIHLYTWLDKRDLDEVAREKSAQDRLDVLTQNARDVIAEVSNEGDFLFVSANAERVLGYSPDALTEMGVHEYMHACRAEYLGTKLNFPKNITLDSVLAEGPFSHSLTIRHTDNSARVIELEGSLFTTNDGEARVVSVVRDITARIAEEQTNFSRQKLESLGTMSAGIAHDFRNLLTTISGSTELLELDATEGRHDQIPRHVRQILSATEQASGLTGQLLTYAGKAPVELEPINVQVVLHSLSPLLHSAIADRAKLSLDIAPDLPPIAASPVAIQQIVINLVTNAVEAMTHSDGNIIVRAIHENRQGEQRHIKIIVADDGEGMDSKTQALMFEPFFTTKFTGRGLGLAALQGLVSAHNGKIEVVSFSGEGSTFTVSLPVFLQDSTTA